MNGLAGTLCLLSLIMLISATAASCSLTGFWNVTYKPEWGGQEVPSANNSSITHISQKGSALQGESSLGNRADGSLVGQAEGDAFDLAITFSETPATVMQLSGSADDDKLQGRFRAASSDGKSWRGSFDGKRMSTNPNAKISGKAQKPKINPLDYMTANVNVAPTPTSLTWITQPNGTKKDKAVITYAPDTILMYGSKPFLWQWWL